MELICCLIFICLNFKYSAQLVINELKINGFLSQNYLKLSPDRDLLDVDTTSDVLPVISKVSDSELIKADDKGQVFDFYDKNQNSYKCWIETDKPRVISELGQNQDVIKQVVSNRKKSCYYYKGKIWVYEYCHLKSTRQVSRMKVNDNYEEFSLGRYYPPRRGLTVNSNLNQVSTEFDDGALCELSGKPRKSKVRFVCANDSKGMFVANVLETSACTYDFVVHVPELCDYFDIHSKDPKTEAFIKCFGYRSKSKPEGDIEKMNSDSYKDQMGNLESILQMIDSTYRDSSILSQYKSLLLKATEKLKAHKIMKDLDTQDSDSSVFELISQLMKVQEKESETPDEDENKKE